MILRTLAATLIAGLCFVIVAAILVALFRPRPQPQPDPVHYDARLDAAVAQFYATKAVADAERIVREAYERETEDHA